MGDVHTRLFIILAIQSTCAKVVRFLHILSVTVSKTIAPLIFIRCLSSYTCLVYLDVSIRPCLRLCLCLVHVLSAQSICPIQNLTIHKRQCTHVSLLVVICGSWKLQSSYWFGSKCSGLFLTFLWRSKLIVEAFFISTVVTCWSLARRRRRRKEH